MRFGLVRRGYSPSGGAERYLLRLAEALRVAGHDTTLFATAEWPGDLWTGQIIRVDGPSPRAFADNLERLNPRAHCDLVFSLERVWKCDAYRAGDGVHRAWLERRRRFEPAWRGAFRALQGKHREILELERAIFSGEGCPLVIANSRMIKEEILRYFPGPEGRIKVIYNGLPAEAVSAPGLRDETRARLGLEANDFAALFVGSGWDRKGLRYAMQAVNYTASGIKLLVAGAGRRRGLPSAKRTQFLGEVKDVRALMEAADVLVLPTIYDPFSNASLEALAAGLPVITTSANGFSEIMRAEIDGDVISGPADIEAFTAMIEKWRETTIPGSREARRDYAVTFTIEKNARETVEALIAINGSL
jgi:UDP-glucose:(heptosyl)LPS alpha-1,3-glucosyltransferase